MVSTGRNILPAVLWRLEISNLLCQTDAFKILSPNLLFDIKQEKGKPSDCVCRSWLSNHTTLPGSVSTFQLDWGSEARDLSSLFFCAPHTFLQSHAHSRINRGLLSPDCSKVGRSTPSWKARLTACTSFARNDVYELPGKSAGSSCQLFNPGPQQGRICPAQGLPAKRTDTGEWNAACPRSPHPGGELIRTEEEGGLFVILSHTPLGQGFLREHL